MALRSSIVHISRKTIYRIFLILFLSLSSLYLPSFYLKNILIASSSSSGIIIGLDGRSKDGNSVNIIGRGFDDCIKGREIGEDRRNWEWYWEVGFIRSIIFVICSAILICIIILYIFMRSLIVFTQSFFFTFSSSCRWYSRDYLYYLSQGLTAFQRLYSNIDGVLATVFLLLIKSPQAFISFLLIK